MRSGSVSGRKFGGRTLPDPIGSEPGYRRPVLVIQDDTFYSEPD